jgi:hypothetical protein
MRLHIAVDTDSIANGQREDPSFCPIALAAYDQIDRLESIEVQPETVHLLLLPDHPEGFSEWFSAPLPAEARAFVKAFDTMQPVEPFEFDLDIPEVVSD